MQMASTSRLHLAQFSQPTISLPAFTTELRNALLALGTLISDVQEWPYELDWGVSNGDLPSLEGLCL